MIKATLTHGGETVKVRWSPGGAVQVEGAGVVAGYVRAFIAPGGGGAYNPARGGFYEGFDPKDGVQVWDALQNLGRRPEWVLKMDEMTLTRKHTPEVYVDDTDPESLLRLHARVLYDRRFEAMPDGGA